MRTFKISLLVFVVVLLMSCATVKTNVVKEGATYKYVDIDPATIIREWQKVVRIPLNVITVEVYYTNPDDDAVIRFATVVFQPTGIIGYSYMIQDRIYVCVYNPTTKCFEPAWDELEERHKKQWRNDYNKYFGLSICS